MHSSVIFAVAAVLGFCGLCRARVLFEDSFESDPFASSRWVVSSWKQDSGEAGQLEYSGGLWGAEGRHGIRTTEDAKFYAFSTKLAEEFDNTEQTLVFGYRVKHEQKMDCGGGYAKLLPPDTDQAAFNGESAYSVMFGPDICGYSTKKVQAILAHNGENLLKTDDVTSPDDEYTHTYVLVVNPDDTYDILVDGESKDAGNLKDAWSFELPKMIKDPEAKKPEDWVDNKMMDDPDSVKPADWEDAEPMVEDPEAVKPDDWDDEEDGEWEPPMVDNPEYKGEWRAERIENPDYQGPWVHPEIDNPEYEERTDVYKRGAVGTIGVEVWQVKSGTVFSDFVLADNLEEVQAFFANHPVDIDAEKEAKTAYDEAQRPDEDEEEPEFGGDELDEEEEEEDKTEL